VRIPANEKADSATKEALDEQLDRTEEYPPQDLTICITEQQNGSEMRNRKLEVGKKSMKKKMDDLITVLIRVNKLIQIQKFCWLSLVF
jgi:hypothetical protein